MKYVALIVCAAIAIVALSAGSTFATLVWARSYFREARPASAASLGKQGQQVPAEAKGCGRPADEVQRLEDALRLAHEDVLARLATG